MRRHKHSIPDDFYPDDFEIIERQQRYKDKKMKRALKRRDWEELEELDY